MVFPLDDNFVFGDNFFSFGDNFFWPRWMINSFLVIFCFLADILWVENFENPAWVSRRARGAERRPEWGAKRRTEAGAEPRGPGGTPKRDFQSFQPTKYQLKQNKILTNKRIYSSNGAKKNYHRRKKNYSPINEVTHPTETPLCLWYDVFMPTPSYNFSGFFLSKPTKKRNFNDVHSVCNPKPKN